MKSDLKVNMLVKQQTDNKKTHVQNVQLRHVTETLSAPEEITAAHGTTTTGKHHATSLSVLYIAESGQRKSTVDHIVTEIFKRKNKKHSTTNFIRNGVPA